MENICLCLVGNFVTQIICGLNLGHMALLQRGRLLLPFNILHKNRIKILRAVARAEARANEGSETPAESVRDA